MAKTIIEPDYQLFGLARFKPPNQLIVKVNVPDDKFKAVDLYAWYHPTYGLLPLKLTSKPQLVKPQQWKLTIESLILVKLNLPLTTGELYGVNREAKLIQPNLHPYLHCRIYDQHQNFLGEIIAVQTTPAPLLTIKLDDQLWYLPLTPAFIKQADQVNHKLIIELIPGLGPVKAN